MCGSWIRGSSASWSARETESFCERDPQTLRPAGRKEQRLVRDLFAIVQHWQCATLRIPARKSSSEPCRQLLKSIRLMKRTAASGDTSELLTTSGWILSLRCGEIKRQAANPLDPAASSMPRVCTAGKELIKLSKVCVCVGGLKALIHSGCCLLCLCIL